MTDTCGPASPDNSLSKNTIRPPRHQHWRACLGYRFLVEELGASVAARGAGDTHTHTHTQLVRMPLGPYRSGIRRVSAGPQPSDGHLADGAAATSPPSRAKLGHLSSVLAKP